MKTIIITHKRLKELLENPPIFRIARENIRGGDICIILWNGYCRRVQRSDNRFDGIAFQDYKKGEEVLLLRRGWVTVLEK